MFHEKKRFERNTPLSFLPLLCSREHIKRCCVSYGITISKLFGRYNFREKQNKKLRASVISYCILETS